MSVKFRWLACLLLAIWGSDSASADSVFFSLSFPGSVPAYFEVAIDGTGTVVYREEAGEEDPLTFSLDEPEREQIFALVQSIGPAEEVAMARKKVAFTGDKVIRLETDDGQVWNAAFQHTEVQAALKAVEWFHHVSESERHRIELERVMMFDRLGVNKALLYFQRSLEKGRIVGAAQFLPILRQVAEDKAVIHMARARAASLAEQIESGAVAQATQ